ncbi:MAG TPA: ATP-binding protein [Gaiellaceae bacterium]|nr:ATP-binding protein [Gaiellaceae bacterium]
MSFRARLVLAAAYLLTAVVLALEIPLALSVERRANADFRSAVLGRAAVLAARVADLVPQADERVVARRQVQAIAEASGREGERVVVVDGAGRTIADSAAEAEPGTLYATVERPEFAAALSGRIDSRSRSSETLGEDLLLVTVPVVEANQVTGAVRVSASSSDVAASVRASWLRLAAIGLVVVVGGLALAWVLATSLARPVRRLATAADRLGHGDLDARAEPSGPRELRALAASFNRMAAALTASLESQREFIANASHQLRTPLTGLKLRLEALRGQGAGDDVAKAEAELDRLSALVDDLLELARAAGSEAPEPAEVDLAAAAEAAADRWSAAAERDGKRISVAADGPALAWASEADVAHVLDNLIENALRYCPPGTAISVGARAEDGRAVLVVADDGPGIPVEDRPRVFERFYRGANGRRAGPGTGLGLAIVAELVDRWGGEVRLGDRPGTCVESAFPRPPTLS